MAQVSGAIGDVLSLAVGVAISPVPIIAVILMLFSKAATSNGPAFLIGWIVGLTGVSVAVLATGVQGSDGNGGSGWIKVVIGAVLLVLAVRQWRSRPGEGDEPAMPGWMSSIDDFTAAKAFGMALVLSAVNPKNLGLTLAAATSIGAAGLDTGQEAVVVAVYVLLASITLIVPVIGFLVARTRMTPWLDSLKSWLTMNNATVMSILFVVLGAKVLGDGISLVAGG